MSSHGRGNDRKGLVYYVKIGRGSGMRIWKSKHCNALIGRMPSGGGNMSNVVKGIIVCQNLLAHSGGWFP